jgi:hypothetical protein
MARCRSDGRSTSERHAIGECRVRRCERARGRLSASNEAMPRAGVRRGETCRRFFSLRSRSGRAVDSEPYRFPRTLFAYVPFCHPFATWQPV